MPNWKKVITSGSSANLNNITASGNISGSGTSTGSFGRIDGNGGNTTIGTATTGLNLEGAGSSIYTAINNIDIVLDKLAPAKPANLSTLALGFSGVTTYTLYGINGQSTSSIITDTTPTIKPEGSDDDPFYDGDTGTLTAYNIVNDGLPSSIGARVLTTGGDTGTYSKLQITADEDPYDGVAGSEGFWKQLKVTINETGRTAGTDKYTNRLVHSVTGTATDLDYYVEGSPSGQLTAISNTNITHSSERNGYHNQSGIPYLGYNDSISSSYTCTINASSNFLNNSRYIGSTRFADTSDATEVKLTVGSAGTSWTAGQVFTTTASIVINDSRYHTGTQGVEYEEYKSTSTSGTEDSGVEITSQAFNIDSLVEDETHPDGSGLPHRSGSGTGQFPTFAYGAAGAAATFGKSFDTELSLKTSNHCELQFSNRYFHWPASTNYTSYFPPGPDYSSMNSDSSHNSLRWATFNLGDITAASSIDIRLENCYGFDSSDPQTSDGFEMYLKVMNGAAEVTKWIDANATYNGGDPGASSDGDAGVTSFTTPGTSGDFLRTITFGTAPRTGTVYVRVGWNVGGGTTPTDAIRKFEYIYIT